MCLSGYFPSQRSYAILVAANRKDRISVIGQWARSPGLASVELLGAVLLNLENEVNTTKRGESPAQCACDAADQCS